MKNDLNARNEYHANQKAADRAAVKMAAVQGYRNLAAQCDGMMPMAMVAFTLDNN